MTHDGEVDSYLIEHHHGMYLGRSGMHGTLGLLEEQDHVATRSRTRAGPNNHEAAPLVEPTKQDYWHDGSPRELIEGSPHR